MKNIYFQFEKKLSLWIQRKGVLLLCVSLGLIYIWFGLLKVFGISPAEELVERSTQWLSVHFIVQLIGLWEVIIGLCILIRKLRRVGIWLYFLHFPGLWLPFITNPEDTFTIIPFGLTLEGQYIVKNLIIACVVLIIWSSLQAPRRKNSLNLSN